MSSSPSSPNSNPQAHPQSSRRNVLTWAAVGGALAASYGTLVAFVGRFVYPKATPRNWFFVMRSRELEVGSAHTFVTPTGEPVNITRRVSDDGNETVSALSSTCPHLGCQVHWEGHNNRFFCPCHNGVFSPDGVATAGPPADAGQSLLQFPIRDEDGLLFIELPAVEVAALPPDAPTVGGAPRLERIEPAAQTCRIDRSSAATEVIS